jgi:hypothetical protein
MHRPGAVLATVLTALALTSTASADTFCVAPATGCSHTATTLQNALSSAGSLPGDDAIKLGAATYAEDNLVYSPGDHSRVTISGASAGSTVIQPASATTLGYTLQATIGPMDVENVHIVAGGAPGTMALVLQSGGRVTYTDTTAAPDAPGPSGIYAATPAALGAVNVTLPGNGACVISAGTGLLLIRQSTLRDCDDGVRGFAHRTAVQLVRLLNVVNGVHIIGDTVSGLLDDSLFVGRGNGTAASVEQQVSSSGANSLELHQDTLIGSGAGTGASASNTVNAYNTDLSIDDSIIRNFSTPMACASSGGDPATLTANYVNYTGALSNSCGAGMTLYNPSTVDPQFVNQGDGDYHLEASSPLVDLDPTPVRSGESDVDLDFTVRIITGKRELGALERPLAPTAKTVQAYGVTDTAALVRVVANGGGAATQATLLYGTSAAYGSELRLEMTPADFNDRIYDIPLTGLTPGTTYHYALVATNSSGTATSADATFTTNSPSSPPPPPVAKAALSALRISPPRFKAAARGATFAKAKTGATVTYAMSGAGAVKLRAYRGVRGVRVGARCVAKSRRHRTGRACTRYVAVGKAISRASAAGSNRMRFSGRIGGKKLRPGRYRLQSLDPAGTIARAAFTIVRR